MTKRPAPAARTHSKSTPAFAWERAIGNVAVLRELALAKVKSEDNFLYADDSEFWAGMYSLLDATSALLKDIQDDDVAQADELRELKHQASALAEGRQPVPGELKAAKEQRAMSKRSTTPRLALLDRLKTQSREHEEP